MTETAKMYGGSLYDLAAEEGKQALFLQQLTEVCALFAAQPDYLRLLCTPSISKAERCGLIDEALAASVEPYVLNFLKILCENGTLNELNGCAREFRNRYNADNGIVEATAWAAVPLTAAQSEALQSKLSGLTGQTVQLRCKTDPRILGGIRLEMEGAQLDGTVQNRLDAIRRSLANTVL